MKSTLHVIRIIYNYLISIGIKQLTGITGNVYWLQRPKNSLLEDIVINSVAFNGSAMQSGVFNINIHVPNIGLQTDNSQPDFARMEQIAAIIINMIANVYGADWNFTVEEPGTPIPDATNWFCNIRVRYWTVRDTYSTT
jgi:hypothetical protein